jgi:SAM-dependent methyltransferase
MVLENHRRYVEIERCRVCGNKELVSILHLGVQYLTGVFPDRVNNDDLTHGPLELVKCNITNAREHCGLVQLRHSYNPKELYGDNYGYRSSLNRLMVDHLQGLAQELLEIVSLRDEDIILDIGSNDGTLLSFYPEKGPLLIGMDPTARKFCKLYKPHIQLLADFFSADRFRQSFGNQKAKIVTSIAMFYDLDDPMAFMREIHEVLADDGIWFLEQSYLPLMLSANAYDTICHEHLEYYALRQIKFMADRTGFKVINVKLNDINGGSFAVTLAKNGSTHIPKNADVEKLLGDEKCLDSRETFELFKERVYSHRADLLRLIWGIKQKRERILGYGASTKGNVILQFCDLSERELDGIAEVNPEKYGRLTPGTWIPIISEEEARSMKPDYFLVMPWHFKQNFLHREANFLQGSGKLIFPLPEIEVVSG